MTPEPEARPAENAAVNIDGRHVKGYVIGAGVILGVMSFAADVAPDPISQIIQAVFSTAAAWCSLAVIAGYMCVSRRSSSLAATGLLLLATLTYYGTIALSGVRAGGYEATQTSAGPVFSSPTWIEELGSMARGVGFWVAASVLAGVVMGQLGFAIRNSSALLQTAAVGVTFGIVAGPGVNALLFVARVGVNTTTSEQILPAICQIALACIILIGAAVLKAKRINWALLALMSLTSTAAVAGLWEMVGDIRGAL
ncbi:DUF6518 family protein [Catellatospora chokoriensis]|uniref:Uncharacterized protein n=1 Tax=Catellatospora chokoriensis TaxID=310353 RepID=A0A8J3K264_9ACTN|nr:DUF6518 family protein [Catellatospora chokoriensis]GIF89355.1 hypothetical protein Cch02nite_27990 [Catellatospora chokoriensis]